ncbi:MAG: hypothetical protein K2H32_10035 [Muribaculaceae bacterium]|nr:hypothetical protein [Muribaculaceae bacterium]
MKHLLFFLLICTCFTVYSQNEFADIEKEVEAWYQSNTYTSNTNTKSPQSINFPTHHYSIYGIIEKGKLADGTFAKFYDTTSSTPELILGGKVSYTADRLVITGVKPLGTNKLYGSFYVSNMDDFTMNYKPKKAGTLRITRDKISYLESLSQDRTVIVSVKNVNTLYFKKNNTERKSISYCSAEIPGISFNDNDSFEVNQILLQANDGVTIQWGDGTIFKGRVKPVQEDSLIRLITLYGQKSNLANGLKRITLSHENGKIIYSQDFNNNENNISNITLFIKDDGSLSEDNYWNYGKLLEHCYLTKWTYQNGNYFEGPIKYQIKQEEGSDVQSISTMIEKGVFKYPNGDRFEGDISQSIGYGSSQLYGDGTTYFKDGSKEKGDWLNKFNLTDSQKKRVLDCLNPSEARELAQQFEHRNHYIKYEGHVEYFNPSEEINEGLWGYITYDKARKRYTCNHKYTNEIKLEFAIDNKGHREWEIVYDKGKPKYLNVFTWYSNGIIESIKSYLYDSETLYLSCNFFSDGKIRSAYQYGKGNYGRNVIRKSKESHPTYGGYTCKLYDLNGDYERTIEWGIGIGESLFGGSYNKKMAPDHIVFSDWKPVDM